MRLRDSEALLRAKRYSGAYYLAGYAVECALKACISKQTKRYAFPPDRDLAGKIYTHNIQQIAEIAKSPVDQESQADPQFGIYWAVVKDWNERSRYEKQGRTKAKEIHTAITEPQHGVLQCIERYW